MEEQKKEDEESEKQKKEREEKAKANADKITAGNLEDMFDPSVAFYTSLEEEGSSELRPLF